MIGNTIIGFASELFGRARSPTNAISLENPAVSLNDPKTWDTVNGDNHESDAGINVSHRSSLSLAPVWQAVSILSGDVASASRHVYKNEEDGDLVIDRNHDLEYLLSVQPNSETSAFEFWRRLMVHVLLWQNAYAYIRRNSRVGPPQELINLLPDRTAPKRNDRGELYYVTEVDGNLEPLFASEVLHVKGLSFDNGVGFDLVCAATNCFGLALGAQKFNSKFFKHGGHAGGILEIPVSMTPRAATNLEEGFRKRLGEDQWFRTVVLRDGAKFHTVTVDAERQQMHQLREDQVREVARYFNLPPRKLGISDSQSYNSSEQDQLQYLQGALLHWFCSINSECNLKLLSERERRTQSRLVKHDASDLLMTDTRTLNEILKMQREVGFINSNEARRKLGYPQRHDPGGESYDNPNTTAGGETGGDGETPDETAATKDGVAADVQSKALNGAQIVSALSIADKLALKQLPAEAVRALFKLCFPDADDGLIEIIVKAIDAYEPPKKEPGSADTSNENQSIDSEDDGGSSKPVDAAFVDRLVATVGSFFEAARREDEEARKGSRERHAELLDKISQLSKKSDDQHALEVDAIGETRNALLAPMERSANAVERAENKVIELRGAIATREQVDEIVVKIAEADRQSRLSKAHRDLFISSAEKLARRIQNESRDRAKKALRFCEWASDGSWFDGPVRDALLFVVNVIAIDQGRNDLAAWQELETWLLSELKSGVKAVAPESQDKFDVGKVNLWTNQFDTAPERWANKFFGGGDAQV